MAGRSIAVGILFLVLGVVVGGLAVLVLTGLGYGPVFPITRYVMLTDTVRDKVTLTETRYATSTVTRASTVYMSTCPATQTPVKWLDPPYEVVSYLDAAKYVGRKATVEGTVVKAFRLGNTVFLDFHEPYQGYFTVVIYSSSLSRFSFTPEAFYSGKEVRVSGQIQSVQGAPQIAVESPSQIEVAHMGFNYP